MVQMLNNQFRHIGGGLLMLMLQTSYSVAIMLDTVVAYGNKQNSNIYIAAGIVDLQNYNLTIMNRSIIKSDITGNIDITQTSHTSTTCMKCVWKKSSHDQLSQLVMVMYLKVMLELLTKAIPVLECSVHLMTTVDCQTVS